MLGAEMPRDTMLITSVSARTAQMLGHHFGIVGLQRKVADLILGDTQVAGDIFQKLAGARRALAGHLVAQYLAAFIDDNGPPMKRATIKNRAGLRVRDKVAPRACEVME